MSIKDKQSKILNIPLEYRKSVLPAPKSAKIELTGRCNYKCSFCALTQRKEQPTKDMDWELFVKITSELRELGTEEIGVFYIGESFMNPDLLVKAISYLKNNLGYPYVFLTSNASLAKPKLVKACMDAGLDSLKWSCNAYDESQFEEMLGVSPKMMDVVKYNIKMAKQIRDCGRYKTKLYASSIEYDKAQFCRMHHFLEENVLPYVDMHYWLPLYSAGGQTGKGDHGYQPRPGNTGRVDDPVEPLPCWTVFTCAHVMVDGSLTACCLDAKGIWKMGDLRTQKFMDAWNSASFVELRKAHLNKNVKGTICEKCVLYN